MRLIVSVAIYCALGCSKSQFPTRQLKSASSRGIDPGPIRFTKLQIESAFRAEGVTVFDVNNVGVNNIVTRQYWYDYPPDLSTRHPISEDRTWPVDLYSNSYADWGADVNGDGWTDLIALPRQNEDIYWYENPRGIDRMWDAHLIARQTLGERPVYENLFGDENQKELVFTVGSTNTLVWAVPGPDPTMPWVTTAISDAGSHEVGLDHHGMGVADINGDGRMDIIVATGWFEGPQDRSQTPWVFHPENWLPAFCRPPSDPESCCADMYAYDVNADGRIDILCTRPHNRGRWWIEQLEDHSWQEHPMDPEPFTTTTPYSESHSARFEDLDNDGIPELITGKRKWAHGFGGEGADQPGVLVYYKLSRDESGVTWNRYDIDLEQSSGVGTQFEVKDVNGDGLLDIIISNKTGLYYYEQIPPP